MDAVDQSSCSGDVTFNLYHDPNTDSSWPYSIPGLVCKTPPVGRFSAPRFSQCCSGPVYNITSPTSPGDDAYPVSCATLCQVDPKENVFNDAYPYYTQHMMCLLGGDVDGEPAQEWEVVCATVDVEGVTATYSKGADAWATYTYSSLPSSEATKQFSAIGGAATSDSAVASFTAPVRGSDASSTMPSKTSKATTSMSTTTTAADEAATTTSKPSKGARQVSVKSWTWVASVLAAVVITSM